MFGCLKTPVQKYKDRTLSDKCLHVNVKMEHFLKHLSTNKDSTLSDKCLHVSYIHTAICGQSRDIGDKPGSSASATNAKLLLSQSSELPVQEHRVASVAAEAGVVPIFATEPKPNPSDQLAAGVARVKSALDVAFLTEKAVFEDHVIQTNLLTTNTASETARVPGEKLASPALHFYSVCPRDLGLAGKACGQVSCKETVLTKRPLAALFIIFLVDKGDVALATNEAPLVPILFTVKNKVFHMDWQLARLATV